MSFWDYLFPTAEDFKMGKSPDVRRRWRSKSRCLVYTGDKIQSKDISVLQCALDLQFSAFNFICFICHAYQSKECVTIG